MSNHMLQSSSVVCVLFLFINSTDSYGICIDFPESNCGYQLFCVQVCAGVHMPVSHVLVKNFTSIEYIYGYALL